MITLQGLAELSQVHGLLESGLASVTPVSIGNAHIGGPEPVVMATVNLSRDSTYRESIAPTTESAVRKARVAWAEGAALIDIGAESSTARAVRVDAATQITQLVPVITQCAEAGIAVSVEGYTPEVIAAGLQAGAGCVNFTGRQHEIQVYDLAAEHHAAVIICYVGGEDVREITDVALDSDPLPGLLDHFGARIDLARSRGVRDIIIDPGMGFYYGNLVDPMIRARHQAVVLLNSFRLRQLGLPICHALPHAFDIFEERFRDAEAFFAVLAALGGASLLRTHEVARVRAVVNALTLLDTKQQ